MLHKKTKKICLENIWKLIPFCLYFSYATIFYNTCSDKHLTKYILSKRAYDLNKYPEFSRVTEILILWQLSKPRFPRKQGLRKEFRMMKLYLGGTKAGHVDRGEMEMRLGKM